MKKFLSVFFALIFSLLFVISTCLAETSPVFPQNESDFASYGNSTALLLVKSDFAELVELNFFFGHFDNYKIDGKIEVLHFAQLYFTYIDAEGNGQLWLFNGNVKPIPFEESNYLDVLYWPYGIIVLTEEGFYQVDISKTFNTSSLTISEEPLTQEMVNSLVN